MSTTLAEIVEADRAALGMTVTAYVEHLGLGSATGAAMTWSRIVGSEPRARPVFAALRHLKASPELAAQALAEVMGLGADTVRIIAGDGGGAKLLAKTTGNRAESGEMAVILEEWFAMIRGPQNDPHSPPDRRAMMYHPPGGQMSDDPADRQATWADVVAAPEPMTAELISGDLILRPRPSARHGRTALRIAQSLAGKDRDAPDGWVILPAAELHLGRPDPQSLVLVPAFSGWRADAVPDIDDAIVVDVVPDWVCEILSPSTQRHDRVAKMSVYASLGVGHVWLVEPVHGFVEVYELRDGLWARVQVASAEEWVVLAPFRVVEVGRWFL